MRTFLKSCSDNSQSLSLADDAPLLLSASLGLAGVWHLLAAAANPCA